MIKAFQRKSTKKPECGREQTYGNVNDNLEGKQIMTENAFLE